MLIFLYTAAILGLIYLFVELYTDNHVDPEFYYVSFNTGGIRCEYYLLDYDEYNIIKYIRSIHYDADNFVIKKDIG